jgi:hypothetical protein
MAGRHPASAAEPRAALLFRLGTEARVAQWGTILMSRT